MNNKRTIERIATIALAAFLVGMFIFQVAHASNESDYKYGYKDGLWEYKQCKIEHICATEENTYDSSCIHVQNLVLTKAAISLGFRYPPYNVDNETACQHGYHHGWVHACLNDGGGAMCTAWHDGGPVIVARTGPGHCYNTTKEGETCESGPMIPIGHH